MYLWLKALHIFAVVAWMAGMLYLPRLFVYHSDTAVGSEASELFKVMERRLLRGIVNPAMIIAVAIGLWLATEASFWSSHWLHAKLALVLVMGALHGHFARAMRDFAKDERRHSARYWRVLNEVPALVLIGILILVVVKPF